MNETAARRRAALLLGAAALVVLVALGLRVRAVLESRAGAVFEALAAWTGLRLVADDVGFGLIPPRVVAWGVRVEVAQDAVSGSPLQAERADLGVALAPLLEGRVVVDGVYLEGLVVRAARLSDGDWNLRPVPAPLPERIVLSPLAVHAERVHLAYRDERLPGSVEVELRSGAIDARIDAALSGVDLTLEATLAGAQEAALKGAGRIPLVKGSPSELHFSVAGIPMERVGEIVRLAGGQIPFDWGGSGVLALAGRIGAPAAWPLTGGRLSFQIDAGEASIEALGGLLGKSRGVPLRIEGEARLGSGGPFIEEIDLDFGGAGIRVRPGAGGGPAAVVGSPGLDLHGLARIVPGLERIDASGEVALSGSVTSAEGGLTGRIDMLAPEVGLGGETHPASLRDAGLRLELQGGGEQLAGILKVSRFAWAALEGGALAGRFAAGASAGQTRADFRWQGVGRQADRFDLEGALEFDGRTIRLLDMTAAGLGGDWTAEGHVTRAASGPWPAELALRWRDLDLSGLLRLAGQSGGLAGRSAGDLHATGVLDGTWAGLLAQAGEFAVGIEGVSIERTLRFLELPSPLARVIASAAHSSGAVRASGVLRAGDLDVERIVIGDVALQLELHGSVPRGGGATLAGTFRLQPRADVASRRLAGLLFGGGGRGAIPVEIGGRWPHFEVEIQSRGKPVER